MAALARSKASLRIFGDDLIPEEITGLLRCEPTQAWRKGDGLSLPSGREFLRRTGAWFLSAAVAEPENLDGQVAELFSHMTSDLKVWAAISQNYRVDLFCGWFMNEPNEGVSISPHTLRLLGERGIPLSVDIYGPDGVRISAPPRPDGPPNETA
jgi:hypothetical protein